MRKITLGVVALSVIVGAFLLGRVSAQDVEPSCEMCPATHVSGAEIERYVAVGLADRITDQQVRSIDIGRSNVQIAVAHRGALDEPRPNSVASHDLVTEVYVVLSGAGTNRTGPDLVGRRVHHPGRHRTSVHEDRRPHHLSDGAHRPRQGGAAHGRGGVGGVSG